MNAYSPAVPYAEAEPILKELIASGITVWNVGAQYGTPTYNSLHLVRDYFTANPPLDYDGEADNRTTGCWVTEVDGEPVDGCDRALANLAGAHPGVLGTLEVPVDRLAELARGDMLNDTVLALAALANFGLNGHDGSRWKALELLDDVTGLEG